MGPEEQQALAKLLFGHSDSAEYYQVTIHDKPVSFRGVRTFANPGVAKASITNTLRGLLNNFEYYSSYRKELKQEAELLKDFKKMSYEKAKELAPKLRDELMNAGLIKIQKI